MTLLSVAGGSPKFDGSAVTTIVHTFVLTAPLAIAVAALAVPLLRGWRPDNNALLAAAVGCTVAGYLIGAFVYDAVFDEALVLQFQENAEARWAATPRTLQHFAACAVSELLV